MTNADTWCIMALHLLASMKTLEDFVVKSSPRSSFIQARVRLLKTSVHYATVKQNALIVVVFSDVPRRYPV